MESDRIRYALSRATTRSDLSRIYRALCKRTHPDVAGGSSASFLELKAAYAIRLAELDSDDFDPFAIVREMGRDERVGDRGALYLSLYRYYSASLNVRKIRQSQALKKRNIRIIRSILYWARRYDPAFSELFIAYDRLPLDSFGPTEFHRAAADVRARLDQAFVQFMEYQEYGRPMTAALARRSLEDALEIIDLYRLEREGVRGFASWLLSELDKEPCF